ncbi:PRD domain-containing protein [Anaerococcus sp. AGMB09787]|uniref:BglG family transcription antiterminator n=1 Tax=Anaerococcus sp. AGMB09787 TaxID=2922869 RepID=UPI001FAE89AC|nr:PRD domain-containing protein [Anaerococcus sp. AGMB09787]
MILRQKQILKNIINKDYSLEELASTYHVSPRTIRSDIKVINQEIGDLELKIVKKNMGNYYLDYNNESSIEKLKSSDIFKNILDNTEPEIRVIHLALIYLLSPSYIKIEELEDELYLSRATIQNDLKEVKKIFADYEIELVAKPNYGQIIKGKEDKIRKLITSLIYKLNDKYLNNLESGNLFLLDRDKFNDVYEIIIRNIFKYKVKISDIALNNLAIHILVAIKRIELGQYVNKNIDNEIKTTNQYLVALNIVRDLNQNMNIEFPNDEVYYIAMHLMGTNLLSEEESVNEEYSLLEKVYQKIVKEIMDVLGIDLSSDKELKTAILLHLKPAVFRFENNLTLRNPLLESIKVNYPLAYETAVIGSKIIKKELCITFNEDELGFIAMHLGAAIERIRSNNDPIRTILVCTTGLGSSKLIEYKLKNKFPNEIKIVATSELYNLDKHSEATYDLIISTVPISSPTNKKVIFIRDIFGDKSFDSIKDYIEEYKLRKIKYLDLNDIYLNLDYDNKEDLLHFMTDDLYKRGKAPKGLYESIMERENVASTSFGNYVAIPHSIKLMTDETFMSISTLKKEIIRDGKPVRLVIMLNISKNAGELIEGIYKFIIDIVDDIDKVKDILSSKSKIELYKKFQSGQNN